MLMSTGFHVYIEDLVVNSVLATDKVVKVFCTFAKFESTTRVLTKFSLFFITVPQFAVSILQLWYTPVTISFSFNKSTNFLKASSSF